MATTAPELTFQQHIADFLVHTHHNGTLEEYEITDTEHAIAEDLLWAFLQATQTDAIRQLAVLLPQPRSSAATDGYAQNRLTLRHHFYETSRGGRFHDKSIAQDVYFRCVNGR